MSILFDIGELVKRCTKCGEIKPLKDFTARKRIKSRNKTYSWCKRCSSKAGCARHHKIHSLPESDPRRQSFLKSKRASRLRCLYKLSEEERDAMIAERGGLCDICKKPPAEGKSLYVDHCHDSGKIRGMLCQTCNSGIGHLCDSPELLRKAIEYLEQQHPSMNSNVLNI